jgi:hypothetical protein
MLLLEQERVVRRGVGRGEHDQHVRERREESAGGL